MSQLIDVVKREGRRPTEPFNRAKLHSSVKAACLSVHSPEGEAHLSANKVCDAVLVWVETRPEITTTDVRRVAAHHLNKIHPDAAYMYKHHTVVL